MKRLPWLLCLMLLLTGCGVQWFPDATVEVISASAGGPYALTGLSTTAVQIFVPLNGGSGSSNKGNPVTFAWSVTSANAANAKITGANTEKNAQFSATLAGTYTVQLKVTSSKDSTKSATATATVTVSAPTETVAVFAGGESHTQVDPATTTPVPLLGKATSLKAGAAFKYQWTVTEKPTGADANDPVFGHLTSARSTFIGKTVGTYKLKLTATSTTDATATGSDTQTINVVQTAPAVETVSASIQSAATGLTEEGIGMANAINLNGSVDSALGQLHTPTAKWSATGPGTAHFGTETATENAFSTTFYADAAGTYTVTLTATSTTNTTITGTKTITITVTDPALGKEGSRFPLASLTRGGQQRTWVYLWNNGAVETITVTGTNTLTHVLDTDPDRPFRTFFSTDTGGLLLTSVVPSGGDFSTYDPGLPVMPTITTPGSETKSYTVKVGTSDKIPHQATLAVEDIGSRTVPAGSFDNVMHISAVTNSSAEGNLQADAWYAPGIGLIEDTNKKLRDYTR